MSGSDGYQLNKDYDISGAPSAPKVIKFGCVIFDDEKNPSSGWVSVNGDKARRIDGVNQLPTDAIYWSNITYESFRLTGIDRNPWLRHDAYLVTKPVDVLLEWGHDPASTPPDYMASFCSTMFNRIMTMVFKLALECDPKIKPATLFSGDTLRTDIRHLLPSLDYPKGEAASIVKQGHAFTEFTKTSMRGMKGSKLLMLRRPRLAYALEILTTPVPKGAFTFVGQRELRALTDNRVKWVNGLNRPCMAEITIEEMQSDIAPIYGFGNSTDREKKIQRSWVAHPEFIALSSISSLEVRNVYLAETYSQLNRSLSPAISRFLSDNHGEASWSVGVIAETIWRSICMAPPKGRGHQPGDERAGTSWQGAWYRAADKVSGFLSASRLADLGYSIASYGYGWVRASISEDQIQDFIRDGLSIGLFPRLSDVGANPYNEGGSMVWGGDKKSRIMAQLTVMNQKNMLWNLDQLPLYDQQQREGVLKKLIETRKSPGAQR